MFWKEGRAGACREIAVEVIEEYRAPYVGPHDAAHNVTELLTYVPSRYLHLLERVVLTNASGLDPAAARERTVWSGIRVGQ